MPAITAVSFNLTFNSTLTLFQNEVRCTINENDFNYSQNPSATIDCSGSLRPSLTGSAFQPYATTVGLYNDANELLLVAKLANPLPISSNTDTTIIIRYDN